MQVENNFIKFKTLEKVNFLAYVKIVIKVFSLKSKKKNINKMVSKTNFII